MGIPAEMTDELPREGIQLFKLASPEESISYIYYFEKIARPYIKHQYELINNRTTWYIGLQAFLFATFGFTIQKKSEIIMNHFDKIRDLSSFHTISYVTSQLDAVIIFLAVTGILISYLFRELIVAASEPIKSLFSLWKTNVWDRLESQQKSQPMPLLTGGTDETHAMGGIRITKYIPLAFGSIWLVLLVAIELVPYLNQSYSAAIPRPAASHPVDSPCARQR